MSAMDGIGSGRRGAGARTAGVARLASLEVTTLASRGVTRLAFWMVPLGLAPLACGGVSGGGETPPIAAPAAKGSGTVSASAALPQAAPHILPEDVDLEITLSPEASPPGVRVRLGARGDGPLVVWRSPQLLDLGGALPAATDSIGSIPIVLDGMSGGTRITLTRPPSGTVWLSYTVKAQAREDGNPPPVSVDPDRFAGAGEAMLLLPEGFEDKTVRATLRVEADEVGTPELTRVATSFGLGAKEAVTARGGDLREGLFTAGLMGHGQFDAPEGNDSAAWLGYTAFDPRPGFADMAGLRTALRILFGAGDAERVTFLFLSDRRLPGDFVVTRRPRSVVTWVSDREPWSAPLRIAVATAVVHGWIGGRLWIGPSDPAHEAEAYWFSEGVSRHLARDLLFRYGLISAQEAAQDVEGLASVLVTSPRGAESSEDLRRNTKGALPVIVARGALYGLEVDAKLRAKSGGKMALQDVLRALYKQAAEAKGPLPVSAWTDAIAKELGEPARARFQDVVVLGKPADLPDAALGPCFRRVKRTYVGYDPGFDEPMTRKAGKIVGLYPGGPADRAQLRDGEAVESIRIARHSPDSKMEVTVTRGDKPVTVTFLPEGKRGKGPGFERKKDVPDDACTP